MGKTRTGWALGLTLALAACGPTLGDGDGVIETDEVPGIGWEAEFVTRAHDVAGTAVIVDEDTIELRDFTFDGGGVDARLFLVTDGAPFSNEFPLTDNLVGTPYDGDTVELEIPEGASFEDWNLITLWCVPFGADFGSGVFLPPE